jgi:hypothetical protein
MKPSGIISSMPASAAPVERAEEADVMRRGRTEPPPVARLAEKKKLIPFG